MHDDVPRPTISTTMRLRVRTIRPLPVAQFVLPVQAGIESLEHVRERISNVISRHYEAELVPDELMLEVDGFLLLDEFGTEALRDDETIVCVFD